MGERVRGLRRAAGLTQRQLAATMGVDSTYLSKIENDRLKHTPSVRTIQSLAAAIGADELELIQLADKLPAVLDVFAREPEARLFLSRAARSLRTAADWKAATEFVERREASRAQRAARRAGGAG